MNQDCILFQESIGKVIKSLNQMIDKIQLIASNHYKKNDCDEFIKNIENSNIIIAQVTSELHSLYITRPELFE